MLRFGLFSPSANKALLRNVAAAAKRRGPGRKRSGGRRDDQQGRWSSADRSYTDVASNRSVREAQREDDGYRFFVACHPFLQEITASELSADTIAAYDIVPGKSGVHFKGRTLATGYAACLWLRTGIRVEVLLAEAQLPVNREAGDTIYDFTRECAHWPDLLKKDQSISVRCHVWSCTNISNSQLATKRIRDAVCDAMRDAGYPRPPPPGTSERRPSQQLVADLPLYASIFRDRISLYRDLSGESLHRRGYRFMMHRAVLNEATAAGMLYVAGWDQLVEERNDAVFADPMCGSGTLLCEAGLMARNIAPGSFRTKWPFQQWPDYNPKQWEKLMYHADEVVNRKWQGKLLGCEIHPRAWQMARIVTHNAKVREMCTMENINCANWVPRPAPDLVVTNPPWGIRLTDDRILAGLEQSWRDLGTFFRTACPGREVFALSGDPELTRHVGMRASRKYPLTVGGVDCRLLKYDVYQQRDDNPEFDGSESKNREKGEKKESSGSIMLDSDKLAWERN
ncbi:hypothetical protein BSKO_04782 [Bryopsis sp. KO-2023]|nr:hypothetical protein BSKO_04782 [Bryopsis sp. KO-2023]